MTRMRAARMALHLTIVSLVGLWMGPPQPVAAGEISFVDMFRSGFATQTGNGNAVSSAQFRFDTHLFSVGAGDFSSVTLLHPGPGSPQALSQTGPTVFALSSGSPGSQAAMDTAFPFGIYTYNATGTPSDSTFFNYVADHYPAAQPFLTGSDFGALQGLSPGAPFTFHFNAFAEDQAVDEQVLFFSIFDQTAGVSVFNSGFLPRSTTQVTVAANTLAPGHDFIYEVIFSNRHLLESEGAEFDALTAFELRTSGRFTTAQVAVPAPAAWALLLTGIAGWSAVATRHRQRARQD